MTEVFIVELGLVVGWWFEVGSDGETDGILSVFGNPKMTWD